jgi:hypothetical protein
MLMLRISRASPVPPVAFTVCTGALHKTSLQINIYYGKHSIIQRAHKSRAPGRLHDSIVYVGANTCICGSSVRNLHHITLLAPLFLRWLLDFWKICEPFFYSMPVIRLSNFPYRYCFYTGKIHFMRDTYAKISCGSRIISVKWLECRFDTLRILVYCDAICNSKHLIQQKPHERQFVAANLYSRFNTTQATIL